MQVHTDIAAFKNVRRPVLTTGTFDGVHRGHRKILEQLTAVARKEGGESVLFTFHPHPRMVLFPSDNDLKLLNTQQEKAAQLEAAGLDHVERQRAGADRAGHGIRLGEPAACRAFRALSQR